MLLTQRICVLFGLVTVLVGCTSVPKKAEADIPLVHSSLSYSLLKEKDRDINIPKLTSSFEKRQIVDITYNGYSYKTDKQYVSATGNACIRFRLTEKLGASTLKQFTTCKRKGQWTVIPPLVLATQEQGK